MYDELKEDIKNAKEKVLSLKEKSLSYDKFVEAGYLDAQSVTLSMETLEDRINTMKDEERSFLIKLIEIINPTYPIPPVPDKDLVINLTKQLRNEQSSLQTAKTKLEKESEVREKELEEQIYQQEVRLKRFEEDLERLQKGYEQLKLENEKLKNQKIENSWFSDLIKKLFERKI